MNLFKKNIPKGQALIELALMLSLIFLFVFWGRQIFFMAQDYRDTDISERNDALKDSENATLSPPNIKEMKAPPIYDFGIPDGGGDFLPDFDSAWPALRGPVLDFLGLDGTQSWWKSGLRGALDSYVASGFNSDEAAWGFAGGVIASGDTKNLLNSNLGSVFGSHVGDILSSGIQGTLTAAVANHDLVFKEGQWGQALLAGATAAYNSEGMQTGLAAAFGDRNFLISTANGAVLGAITGERHGYLLGAAKGALASSLVQGGIQRIAFGKDYLASAINVTAFNTISGSKEPIFYAAAQAAFMSGSIQRGIFGENPGNILKGLQGMANATFSGGLMAIRHDDIDYLVNAAKGAAIGEVSRYVMREAVGLFHKAPEKPAEGSDKEAMDKYEADMGKYVGTVEFAASLGATATVVLADPELGAGYANMMAQQMLYQKIGDEIKELRGEKAQESQGGSQDSSGSSDGGSGTSSPDAGESGAPGQETAPPQAPAIEEYNLEMFMEQERLQDGNVPQASYFEKKLDQEIKKAFKNEIHLASIAKSVKSPLADDTRNFEALFASSYNDASLASRRARVAKLNSETFAENSKSLPLKKAVPQNIQNPDSQEERPLTENEIEYLFERFETVSADEIVNGPFYREILKYKPDAKTSLHRELAKHLTYITATGLLKKGLVDTQIKALLKSKGYENSLLKALKNPQVVKRIDEIVDFALSKENLRQSIKDIQERIMIARAYQTESAIRQALLASEKSGAVFRKPEREKTLIEKVKGIFG